MTLIEGEEKIIQKSLFCQPFRFYGKSHNNSKFGRNQ